MSDPGQGPEIPPDPGQYSGHHHTPYPGQYGDYQHPYQYPSAGQPGQSGPPPWQQGQAVPKQPLTAWLASALDSWQKVVLAGTALIVALGGLAAAVESSHPGSSNNNAPQLGPVTNSSGAYSQPTDLQPPASTPANTSPGPVFSIPALTQAAGPSAACQQGQAAITTFNQTAGSTPLSERNAVERALNGIQQAIQSSGGGGSVYSDLVILNSDFERLFEDASGPGGGSDYSTTLAQTNVDSQQFAKDCNT